MGTTTGSADSGTPGRAPHFSDELLFRAATLYYIDEATQAEVAVQLGTSRPTVSRLLSEARARGIVRIDVQMPSHETLDTDALADELAEALGLNAAWVVPTVGDKAAGPILAPAVAQALDRCHLVAGDAVLVSSGETVAAVSREPMPKLTGVVMAPTVGGQDEREAHFQTNEITRQLANKTGALPIFLYAPAMPGPELHRRLIEDPGIDRVLRLWERPSCALLGIGAPPLTRRSLPTVMTTDLSVLRASVGDICTRPYDRSGHPLDFPGSDRLVAMELDQLTRVPHAIGVAVGTAKAESILVAARAHYINELVTDAITALTLISAARNLPPSAAQKPAQKPAQSGRSEPAPRSPRSTAKKPAASVG